MPCRQHTHLGYQSLLVLARRLRPLPLRRASLACCATGAALRTQVPDNSSPADRTQKLPSARPLSIRLSQARPATKHLIRAFSRSSYPKRVIPSPVIPPDWSRQRCSVCSPISKRVAISPIEWLSDYRNSMPRCSSRICPGVGRFRGSRFNTTSRDGGDNTFRRSLRRPVTYGNELRADKRKPNQIINSSQSQEAIRANTAIHCCQ